MEFTFTPEQEAFRGQVQTFIQENWTPPPPTAHPGDDVTNEAERRYEKRLAGNGWLTMAWPKEYGGAGVERCSSSSSTRRCAVRAARREAAGMGIGMVGPTLIVHGNEEQKQEHLPRSRRARCTGARASASPAPARTSRRCRRARCATATTTSSTGRRSGRRARTTRTGCSRAGAHRPGRAEAPRHLATSCST